jgi:hypothetical protein
MNVKFINAKQAIEIHVYKKTKRKLHKTNASIWFNKICRDKPLPAQPGQRSRSPHVYINQRLQIQFGAPDDERYAARNMLSFQEILE